MTNHALQTMDFSPAIGSLEAYTHWVNQIPLLTLEEEQSLANQLHEQGDLTAAKKLVMAHLRFVVKVAKGYAGYGLPQADLIQEGNIGLMKAVRRFNPKVGVRLVSFAIHWIKAEMHEYIIKNWRIVKIATTKSQRKLFFNLRSMRKRLDHLTEDEVKDIAETLDVKPEEIRHMDQRLSANDMAFDMGPTDVDSSNFANLAPAQYLPDEASNPALMLEVSDTSQDSRARLAQALQNLDSRSQDIIQKRWLSEKKSTLHDLADNYQVSAERIRQLEQQAMQKLKAALAS